MQSDIVIVSRHTGAIQWLRELGFGPDIPVIATATPDDVRGKWVIGNVPMQLASLALGVLAIEFSGAPPRGQEYGVEEMRKAGARLSAYFVTRSRSTDIAQGCGWGEAPSVPVAVRPWVTAHAYPPSDCMGGAQGYQAR